MATYIIRRLLHTLLVVFAAVIVVFVLVRLSGDPAEMMAGPTATPAEIEQLRHDLGFDRPIYVQLISYLGDALRGDLGDSLRYKEPALKVVAARLPATLELTMIAMAISILIAVPAGVISATRRDGIIDRVVMLLAVIGQTVPVFWLGIVMIVIFAVQLKWLPTSGRGSWEQLLMPATALALYNMARIARLVRSEMLDVISQEYVRVARSKGLTEKVIVLRHALKNAAIPVITIIGLQFGHLLGGAVVTETVFAWPGLGRLMVQSIGFRDFPTIQVAVLILAIAVALINLLIDLSYAWFDPRIRYG